ncbi:UNVERIFIED_ORG: DNA-binding phage protein [Arthrobacter sp. UYEF13]
MVEQSAFWDDLAEDLKDPEFLRAYIVETVRIAAIDKMVNDLDEAREAAGLSKADLARAIGADPSTMRRLFSGTASNPTLGTLSEVAAALGLRVCLEPLPKEEQHLLTKPLIEGRTSDASALANFVSSMQGHGTVAAV